MSQAPEFRPIEGYPGYRVGNDGSVWSQRVKGSHVASATAPWRPLKLYRYKGGYVQVRLKRNGVTKCFRVHILVLTAFRGPCPEGMEGCHSPDPNKANCRLDNLRWDTHGGNMTDAKNHGTLAVGERHGRRRLNAATVRAMRMMKGKATLAQIGDMFNTTEANAHLILSGKTWRSIL